LAIGARPKMPSWTALGLVYASLFNKVHLDRSSTDMNSARKMGENGFLESCGVAVAPELES
jgi:hypothetical protein